MAFYVGQKVVCIKRGQWLTVFGDVAPGENYPECGCVYTVRDIEDDDTFGAGIRLEEIRNTPDEDVGECTFSVNRFRPLVEKKTSIEIFQRMLLPIKEDANV